MGDRRRHPRLEVAIEAQYRAEGSVLGRRATLTTISKNSMAFVAEEQLEPGATLEYLRFTIGEEPTTHTLAPECEVVRCTRQAGVGRDSDYLIAVRVRRLDDADQGRLAEFVRVGLEEAASHNPRVDLERTVLIRFERFDQFVNEVSKNLSRTGMFIQSERPQATGTRFEFILQLGDDFKLVQGQAQVVWSRAKSEGRDLPPGMGIKFLSLDKTSETVLSRLIGDRTQLATPRSIAAGPGGESIAGDEAKDAPVADEPLTH